MRSQIASAMVPFWSQRLGLWRDRRADQDRLGGELHQHDALTR
jgi:hypothetical protein